MKKFRKTIIKADFRAGKTENYVKQDGFCFLEHEPGRSGNTVFSVLITLAERNPEEYRQENTDTRDK